MIVELHGLQVFGYHGAYEREQRLGQVLLFDVELEVGGRGASDELEEAVDYAAVASAIRELSDSRRFNLLEALVSATADMLVERFRPERVRVRIRKPQAEPGGLEVAYAAVTATRP